MKKIRSTLLILALAAGFNANAEPSRAIGFLMNQPLSVFDFGLYRMQEELGRWMSHRRFDLPSNSRFTSTIDYREEQNKLRIRLNIRVPHSYLYDITVKEKACSRVVTGLRRYFHAIPISRDARKLSKEERASAGIYKYFSFRGVNESGRPSNAMDEIESLTEIRVMLVAGGRLKEAFKCTAPLLGEDVVYLEEPGPFKD